MANVDRLRQLMLALIEKTLEGETQWELSDRIGTFFTSGGPGSILVRSIDGDGARPYELALRNEDGLEIEVLTEDRSRDQIFDKELARLYSVARSNALNIDATIDSWFEELGSTPALPDEGPATWDPDGKEPF